MAFILKPIYKTYIHYVDEIVDPRMDDYFLMGSPFKLAAVLFVYVCFVKKIGPFLMKNVEPFELKTAMIVYNILQVIVNLILGLLALIYLIQTRPNMTCYLMNYGDEAKAQKEAMFCYSFYIVKLIDLTDTVFFVLRKKYNQISFLHVYHHCLVTTVSYLATRYVPGGHAAIVAVVNCFVHFAMYFYYYRTCIRPEVKKSVAWKKHITHIQMLQFAYLIVHFAIPIIRGNCGYSQFWLYLGMTQNIFLFGLFSNFYVRAYLSKSKKSIE